MTSIGMNLRAVTYWATEEPFIDRFKTSGAWTAYGPQGSLSTPVPVDQYGNPTGVPADATSIAVSFAIDPSDEAPIDRYVMTYSGSATSFSLNNVKIVSKEAGQIVFDVTNPGAESIFMRVTGMSASDPLHDIHVVRADQVLLFNAGEIFNPAFVEKASQWDVLRFMEWGNTNKSAPVDWATRAVAADVSWAQNNADDGVPLEIMVKLANTAHTDMWYNVPTLADDAFVASALSYIRDNLAPGLKVHVEYSNEVWNSAFAASKYAQTQANTLWGVDANHDGAVDPVAGGNMVYYGYRSAQIASIAHKVFGNQAGDRLIDVLSGQETSSSLTTSYTIKGVALAGVGSVSALFSDYAIATYFGNELEVTSRNAAQQAIVVGWARGGAAGLDAAFQELEHGGKLALDLSLDKVITLWAKQAAIAQQYGLHLVAYEGGASLQASQFAAADQPDVIALFGAMMNDPRMGQLYTKMVAGFAAVGGTELNAFSDVGANSKTGYWGVLDTIYDTSSPRYDALLSAAANNYVNPAHPAAASAAVASDFNGDGRSDIIWRNVNGTIETWTLGSTGFQPKSFTMMVDAGWKVAGTLDYNGDGRADILWRNTGGAVSIWKADGTGFSGGYSDNSVGTNWQIAATGDFNGDGKDDILWRNDLGKLSVWQATGDGFKSDGGLQVSASTDWKIVTTGDFNGDGRDDILWRQDGGAVSIWSADSAGFHGSLLDTSMAKSWHIEGVGDFNGDGRDDILWRNEAGAIMVWQAYQNDFIRDARYADVAKAWTVEQVGDFDGDGRDDILWRHDNGSLTVWTSTGTAFTGSTLSSSGANTAWSIAAHDLPFG